MKEIIVPGSIGLCFIARKRPEVPELCASDLSAYLSGLTGKYALDSIMERANQVTLYLGEGQGKVDFCCRPGELAGGASTSLMGPGFHQTVIELLEDLAKVFQLDLDIEDPAGYWQHRAFNQLQQHYVNWLAEQFQAVLAGGKQQYFDWEQGTEFTVSGEGLSIRSEILVTPMGAFSAETLQKVVREDGWASFARDYFLWFHSDKEGYYYRSAAIFALWNSRLTEQAEFILAKFGQARKLNPDIPIPLRETEKLAQLTGEAADFGGPDMLLTVPAGYCRGLIRYALPEGWSVSVPGEFTMEAEYDDDENSIYPVTFYCDDKYVRFLYTYTDKEAGAADSGQIWQRQGDHLYLCRDYFTYTARKEQGQQWSCEVQAAGRCLVVEFEGKAGEWNSWVRNIFESISKGK